MSNNIPTIIAIIIMIFGFSSALIYPIIKYKKIRNKTANYKKTIGKMIDYDEVFVRPMNSTDDSWGWFRHPIIVYIVDDKEYQITSKVRYTKGGLLFKKKFNVLYNPDNPNEAELTNERNLYMIIIIAFIIAIILMLYFMINDLILKNNESNVYEYDISCNISGYTLTEQKTIIAKNAQEAFEIIDNMYKEKGWECSYTLKDTNIKK